MKQRPILFSTEMVQAILEGRKTQTRRIIKEMEPWGDEWEVRPVKEEHMDGIPRYEIRSGTRYALPYFKCPYGQPGDILYVRETWRPENMRSHDEYMVGVRYKAGNDWQQTPLFGPVYNAFHAGKGEQWQPSIFMPKEAARIFLRITDIRVERLQDITEEDAEKEGILVGDEGFECWDYIKKAWGNFGFSPAESFRTLWQSINGPNSWQTNPWLWVVSFERVDKPD